MNYWFSVKHTFDDCNQHFVPRTSSTPHPLLKLKVHLQTLHVDISCIQHKIEKLKLDLMKKGIRPLIMDPCRKDATFFDANVNDGYQHEQENDLRIMKTCGAIPTNVQSAQLSPEVLDTLSDIKKQLQMKKCLHHAYYYLESQYHACLTQDFPKMSMLFE